MRQVQQAVEAPAKVWVLQKVEDKVECAVAVRQETGQ